MRYDCWIVNIVCHVESKLRRIRNTEATDSVLRVMVDQLVDHFKLLLLLDVKPELSGRNFNSHLGEQSDDERLTNVDGCNCLLRISCHPSKKVGIIDTIKPPKRWQDLQIFETDIPRKLIS
ncbi:uncharacterized protein PHALS_09053 [Plasmopara halstedii]|uniref:Uncharacterized protein n=1 Tax=Plasmopara halstedii TaxID=4781 RepID=A0A0P1AEJ8_PLAHL|nr:uncharacterized protein PHALS_09053 [Plasmopara halstedii]CEG38988.1 hypothetical protein PHALS_09053 [Plasmopara halstedii]|eukprot:XP_024575357.1 hypothetical protein PHALS_09053 [Plasmopara halstedii]